MLKVAVVILNYNGKHFLEKFLGSVILYSKGINYQVIVADNASTDDSIQFLNSHYPEVRTIILDKNYGFAGGYNKALEQIDSEYFVLLNSDVEVSENWIKPIIKLMDSNTKIAACQPKILAYHNKTQFEHAGAAGGYLDKYGYPFCRGRLFHKCETDKGQYNAPKEVFWASGAALFIRKEDYFNAGGLDETFFAHMEEIDLCWRLKNRDKSIYSVPESKVYHVGGGTLNAESPRKTYLNFRNNLFMLYKNLPDEDLDKIISTRLMLDFIAALQFLVKFKFQNIKSIWKAHREFFSTKKEYKEKRKVNMSKSKVKHPYGMLHTSIVYLFFVKSKRKFSQIEDLIS